MVPYHDTGVGAPDTFPYGPRSGAFRRTAGRGGRALPHHPSRVCADGKPLPPAVESVRGEPWEDFVNRHGDWGRDLALYVGRSRCGLTLKELGRYVGMNIRTVSQAAKRIEARLKKEKELSTTYRKTQNPGGSKGMKNVFFHAFTPLGSSEVPYGMYGTPVPSA